MNWVVDNWYVLVAILAVAIAFIVAVVKFFKLPTDKQIANVKEWLKLAVAEAEKELGSGTGQLKLRMVYEMAISHFPWIAKVIDFETFSKWVDEALIWLDNQLVNNRDVYRIVKEGK